MVVFLGSKNTSVELALKSKSAYIESEAMGDWNLGQIDFSLFFSENQHCNGF